MFIKLSNEVINSQEVAAIYRGHDPGEKRTYFISFIWKTPKNDLKINCSSKEDRDKLFDQICTKLKASELC